MRIAVFGGTFNPVHTEHIALARAAINELSLDKLIIMPTFSPPHKTLLPALPEHRLKMLKIAFGDQEKVEISDYEISKGGKSYSYITAETLRCEYKTDEIFFIVGEDMLTDFKTWKNPERILKSVKLAVFKRQGYNADYNAEKEYFSRNFSDTFIKLNYTGKIISSTKIRLALAFGLKPNGLPSAVYDYILKENVYPAPYYADFLKAHLTEKRLIHTVNVAECALKKAKALNIGEEKVLLAAMLHDCAKYLDYKDYEGFVPIEGVPKNVIHQFLGEHVARNVLGVKDEDVLDAIKYHTTGKAGMTALGKLIFVADMVEDGRTYDGVDILRAAYYSDSGIDECFNVCLAEVVRFLTAENEYIYKETLNAYDYYIKDGKK